MNNTSPLLSATLDSVHSLTRAPRLQVVSDLLGLQAQFARNPYFSLRLRASDWDEEGWGQGLVKIWSFRGTIHVTRADELGLYLSAAGETGDFNDGWWGMTREEQARWSPFLLDEIACGNDTRDGLKQACREAGMPDALLSKAFYGWGGLIKEMVWRGLIVCGTGTDKRYQVAPPVAWTERDEAREALIERYFTTYGPATLDDCAAFFGWKRGGMTPLMKRVVAQLDALDIDGKRYYTARPLSDIELPECVLLPGFDQTVMAYKDRTRMIDPRNARKVVNMAGIVFPLAVVRGKVRARWKAENGRLIVTPFERLYKKDVAAIRRVARRELGLKKQSLRRSENCRRPSYRIH